MQVAQSSPKNADHNNPRYNPIKFSFINHQTMSRISVLLPPSSILSGALELNNAKPIFFVSVLNDRIRLDPSQNTSQVKDVLQQTVLILGLNHLIVPYRRELVDAY